MSAPSSVERRAGLEIRAADGTALATDIYHPRRSGPWPVVLLRTYLGKASHRAEAMGWARRGFACAVQDVRGRHDSGGDWRPYAGERGDGRDTVRWLLGQPWCGGRIVAAGGSYAAFTAWSAAVAHPAVRAVISAVPAMRPMPLQPEDGGVLPLLSRISWWATHAGARRARNGLAEALLERDAEALAQLPVVDLPGRLGAPLLGWRDAVLETEAPFAAEPISEAELATLDVAALHVGGWHDPFCSETLRQLELVGRELDPRPPRALVLGPWWHRLAPGRPARYGERRYGEASRFPLGRFQADWLRRVLHGESPETTLRVFLCGENHWLEDAGWESRPLTTSKLYAAAGRLTRRPPRSSGDATFVYDPRDPHPCRRTPLDESALPERGDVVVFESATLDRPCRVVGAPRVVVWGRSDAPSVDWVARLLEVTTDGRRLYLAHGLVDAARALAESGERLEPGVLHRVELRLSPLGVSVPRGSRLRLELTGSAFPSYARNLASGESRLTGSRPATARQTVCWGPACATVLELPVHVDLAAASTVDGLGAEIAPRVAVVASEIAATTSNAAVADGAIDEAGVGGGQ